MSLLTTLTIILGIQRLKDIRCEISIKIVNKIIFRLMIIHKGDTNIISGENLYGYEEPIFLF